MRKFSQSFDQIEKMQKKTLFSILKKKMFKNVIVNFDYIRIIVDRNIEKYLQRTKDIK